MAQSPSSSNHNSITITTTAGGTSTTSPWYTGNTITWPANVVYDAGVYQIPYQPNASYTPKQIAWMRPDGTWEYYYAYSPPKQPQPKQRTRFARTLSKAAYAESILG
jgi:hypothetical protein